jgi:hypothetical protein
MTEARTLCLRPRAVKPATTLPLLRYCNPVVVIVPDVFVVLPRMALFPYT